MSKKKVDPGEVLVNKLNVGLANHRRLLASWTGLKPEDEPRNGGFAQEPEEEDFADEALGHEQLGVGGKPPKDDLSGSFTRRTMTSNDKLLQQLLGKKAAKAHIAAKQAPKEHQAAKAVPPSKKPTKEESEDEEEGRAARFKSKRRKTAQSTQTRDGEELSESLPVEFEAASPDDPVGPGGAFDESGSATVKNQDIEGEEAAAEDQDLKSPPKLKSASYLDEILAERSKRAKKRKRNKLNKINAES